MRILGHMRGEVIDAGEKTHADEYYDSFSPRLYY
jgi:hypothetical protein